MLSATATRLSLSPADVDRSLDVHPLAGSNVLLIVGKSSSPQLAAQIANGIVQEGISERTARVQAQVSAIIAKLRKSTNADAQRRVVDLETLQAGRPDARDAQRRNGADEAGMAQAWLRHRDDDARRGGACDALSSRAAARRTSAPDDA